VSKLFGLENQNAANILLRGTDAMKDFEGAMTGTNAATDAARIIMDTTAGRMEVMKAKWENLGISVFGATKEYLPFLQNTADVAAKVGMMMPLLQVLGGGFMAVAGSVWRFVAAQGIAGLSMVRNGLLMVGAGLIGAASFALGLVSATAAQWALNVAMSANPIGLIILGLVAVGTAVFLIIKYWDTLKEWLLNLGRFMLENNPFYLMVKGIFQLFPGVEKWFNDLWGKVTGFLHRMVGHIKVIWDKLAPFLGMGAMGSIEIDASVIKVMPGQDPFAMPGGPNDQTLGGNRNIKNRVDKVASGGSKPTTVNISIAKFQDAININTTNLTAGVNDMVAQLEEALTRVTNGVSQGIGN
jgi:hypothetical protein